MYTYIKTYTCAHTPGQAMKSMWNGGVRSMAEYEAARYACINTCFWSRITRNGGMPIPLVPASCPHLQSHNYHRIQTIKHTYIHTYIPSNTRWSECPTPQISREPCVTRCTRTKRPSPRTRSCFTMPRTTPRPLARPPPSQSMPQRCAKPQYVRSYSNMHTQNIFTCVCV